MKNKVIGTETQLDRLDPVIQNMILATITTGVASIVLYIFFSRTQGLVLPQVKMVVLVFALIGPVLGYITGKERKKMLQMQKEEQTLRLVFGKRENLFQKSRQQLQVLLDNASDAIFLTDHEGKILQFNSALTLMSGYESFELKHMTLKDLELQFNSDKQGKTWLDNGIYRHMKVWRKKNRSNIKLEINTRFFSKGNRQFALHVARDVMHRTEDLIQEIYAQIYAVQHDKVWESAMMQNQIIKRTQTLMNGMMELLKAHANTFSKEDPKLVNVLHDFKRLKNYMQLIQAKSKRDLTTDEALFNLNELLFQELTYFRALYADGKITVQTDFQQDLPEMPYHGFDFSLAFGAVFHTLFEALSGSGEGRLRIATSTDRGNILIGIDAPPIQDFERSLMKTVNPGGSEEEIHLAAEIPRNLFNPLNAKLDVASSEEKLNITVTIPYKDVEEEAFNEAEPHIIPEKSRLEQLHEVYPESKDHEDESDPRANDYVIL